MVSPRAGPTCSRRTATSGLLSCLPDEACSRPQARGLSHQLSDKETTYVGTTQCCSLLPAGGKPLSPGPGQPLLGDQDRHPGLATSDRAFSPQELDCTPRGTGGSGRFSDLRCTWSPYPPGSSQGIEEKQWLIGLSLGPLAIPGLSSLKCAGPTPATLLLIPLKRTSRCQWL